MEDQSQSFQFKIDLSLEVASPITIKHEQRASSLKPQASNIIAVQMSLYSIAIAADYNGPLKAAHADIYDERFDER